ncbi:MAG: thiamine pyrophosphate-dependent enzyme [Bacteroidota bacterium]
MKNKTAKKYYKEEVLKDFISCYQSRLASNSMRKETLGGKAKFGIEGGGKELPQIALAKVFQKGDYYSGYYRDQTFMLRKGISNVEQLFAALYGDAVHDPFSGGRQMNNHFASPFIDKEGNWIDQTESYNIASGLAPLGGNISHALGLALATKKYRENPNQTDAHLFSKNGNEISICTVGDATTSEGVFFEALNAAAVMKVPLVYVIYDDGHGISVPTKYQTTKESISEILEGFRINKEGEGAYIYTAKGWDYEGLIEVFEEGIAKVRETLNPAIFHIQECTQPNGHSTSGSHTRYKSKERLQFEKDADGIEALQKWILQNGFATEEEILAIRKRIEQEVKTSIKKAWNVHSAPVEEAMDKLSSIYTRIKSHSVDEFELITYIEDLKDLFYPVLSDLIKHAEHVMMLAAGNERIDLGELEQWYEHYKSLIESRYEGNLVSEGTYSPLSIDGQPPIYEEESELVNGSEVLKANFDALFSKYDNLYAFGEDVGKIGGVNQAMAGLQDKYGEERIFDTGIREWTIVSQAIGMAMRGLRPIAEIQYIDYIHYALSPLADDLATLRYRSNGLQKSPTIIRTRGHRLEGIWHSGSPMAMLLHSMRGIHICTPRNMTQAAGMYNTLMQGDDPAIVVEVLNGYRKKEPMPSNPGEYYVPLGEVEVLQEGTDLSLVTYGACVEVAETAVKMLKKKGISVELIDVQTLLPFDRNHDILKSLQKTNRIVFLDEDVPGGASSYMLQEVIEGQKGFRYLDAPPKTITAKACRPPYGNDGDYFAKPQAMDVFKVLYEMMRESNPSRFSRPFTSLPEVPTY